MNRSRQILGRSGMVSDGGAPRCRACNQPLKFNTDRQGRTTESCPCGYTGYVTTRPGQVPAREDPRDKA